MHRLPRAATDPGDHGKYRLGVESLVQLRLPALRRTLQLPNLQLPATLDAEMDPPLALQRRILAAVVRILGAEEVLENIEHALALQRIGIGGDDGRELQRVVAGTANRVSRQLLQVRDQHRHGRVIELEARHQIVERPTVWIDACADRAREIFIGVAAAPWARRLTTWIRHIRRIHRTGTKQIFASDRRNDDPSFLGSQSAATVAVDAGGSRTFNRFGALPLATQWRSGRENSLTIKHLGAGRHRCRWLGPRARRQQRRYEESNRSA